MSNINLLVEEGMKDHFKKHWDKYLIGAGVVGSALLAKHIISKDANASVSPYSVGPKSPSQLPKELPKHNTSPNDFMEPRLPGQPLYPGGPRPPLDHEPSILKNFSHGFKYRV